MELKQEKKFKEQFKMSYKDNEGKLFHEFEYFSVLNLVEGEDFYRKRPFIVFNNAKVYQWNGKEFEYVGKYNSKRIKIIYPE